MRRPSSRETRRSDVEAVTLTVERLVPGGQGLCRGHDGVVFVDGVAAGDVIAAHLDRRQRGVGRARLASIVQPSMDRRSTSEIDADCAVSAQCGGCDWLHLTTAARRSWKAAIVADALRRVGRFDEGQLNRALQPLRFGDESDRRLTGRRRVRLVMGARGEPTFSAARSHARVVVEACRALHPRLEHAVLALPSVGLATGLEVRLAVDDADHVVAAVTHIEQARRLWEAGVVSGVVVVARRQDESSAPSADVATFGDALLVGEITAGRFAASSDAACFAQATRFGGEAIVQAVLDGVDDVIDGATVLELFCGAGHLSLPLGARAARVVAIEGDARAVGFLRRNRRLVEGGENRIDPRVAFIDVRLPLPRADVVVVDPPRTGMVDGRAVLGGLAAQSVRRLIMVSCDPATGARDLRAAVDAGFTLQRIEPIDAFPRTHHVEWVATLSLGEAAPVVKTAG